ncbi:MAG: hypothetical protein WCE64_03645 [Bacteroidales bacterium]
MITRSFITAILTLIFLLPVHAQEKKDQSALKREVTLYNPYKPSLNDARKKSFLPEIADSSKVTKKFSYNVVSGPYSPEYTISPIKSAALLSDPLPKLYKGYVKAGLGNNTTPLGELSIASTRSKKGAAGFYARHYSSNGFVPLANRQRVFAGFMDNDADLYGKKFFRKSVLDITALYKQRTRYAYGYDTDIAEMFYDPGKKNVRTGYYDAGAAASYSSLNLDSTSFSYDFDLAYDYFNNTDDVFYHHLGFGGSMSKLYKGFYSGADIKLDHYKFTQSLGLDPKYIFSVNPYVRKNTGNWNFNLGVSLVVDRNLEEAAKFHFYPDVKFGFSVVPEYLRFFTSLTGRLEKNDPVNVFDENPYIINDGSMFRVPNTSYPLIVSAGLKGNNGLEGNYLVSVSYSVINDMLLYSNIVFPDTASMIERGNHFIVLPDDAELLNIHGEMNGAFTKKMTFSAEGNYYKYTLSANEYAWNKPDWDGKIGLYYNLRNKIIAGTQVTLIGTRRFLVSQSPTGWTTLTPHVITNPAYVNLGFSAEYRYSKILSVWFRINNISGKRYYEWAFYPSQMFNFMLGFSYSL